MFVDDPHYVQQSTTFEHILLRWSTIYTKTKWNRITSWKLNGSLPYVYILPKEKDLAKFRPIMSYVRHPMRSLFKLVGQALLFILYNIPSHIQHFALLKINELVSKVNGIQSHLIHQFQHPALLIASMDIKNMYTNLSHQSIRRSIQWLIEVGRDDRRRSIHYNTISIHRRKRSDVHFGRNYNNIAYVTINVTTLLDVVDFDLNQCIFTIGDIISKQVDGIPMGGYLSAIMAIVTCSYSEYQFHSTLGVDVMYIRAIRYMDDLNTFIVYDSQSLASYEHAKKLQHQIIHTCYDPTLELETQPINDNQYQYLEANINISNINDITVFPLRKNYQSIITTNQQKIFKFQHYTYSYSSAHAKRGAIIGTIHRLIRNSNNNILLFIALNQLYIELATLSYSLRCYTQALHHVYTTTNNIIIQCALQFLLLI